MLLRNRNSLTSAGILDNTTELGASVQVPQGSDNIINSTGHVSWRLSARLL